LELILFWKSKKLKDRISATKKIKVCGVLFEIKKINVLDHARGAKVLQKIYETYSVRPENSQVEDKDLKSMRAAYTDIIESGVINPKLSRKEKEGYILISEVFNDWELTENLVTEIMEFTYGKKKLV
jgi:hypothetical protein